MSRHPIEIVLDRILEILGKETVGEETKGKLLNNLYGLYDRGHFEGRDYGKEIGSWQEQLKQRDRILKGDLSGYYPCDRCGRDRPEYELFQYMGKATCLNTLECSYVRGDLPDRIAKYHMGELEGVQRNVPPQDT